MREFPLLRSKQLPFPPSTALGAGPGSTTQPEGSAGRTLGLARVARIEQRSVRCPESLHVLGSSNKPSNRGG